MSEAAEMELTITVVSGLPRSGTSLLMQMLLAAGIPVFADGTRSADMDNPKGYFESARVMALRRDANWLPEARGHAIKIVAPLLGAIPEGIDFRVLWMRRDLNEVLASQTLMMERAGQADIADDGALRAAFENQIASARTNLEQRGVAILDIEHARALSQPQAVARELCDFLGGGLDAAAAAATVDPSLYRQRAR